MNPASITTIIGTIAYKITCNIEIGSEVVVKKVLLTHGSVRLQYLSDSYILKRCRVEIANMSRLFS